MAAENQDNKSEGWPLHPVPPLCKGRLGGVETLRQFRPSANQLANGGYWKIRPPLAPPYQGAEKELSVEG